MSGAPRVRGSFVTVGARLAALGVTACAPAWASGCASSAGPPPAAAPAPAEAPATALDHLEQRLLAASTFHVRARLATSGRIASHFDGTVDAGEGQRMRVAFQGALGGKDADVVFTCDGARMRGGARGQAIDMDAAPGMREGVAVAFVRMGLTHDVAMLARGRTMDYLDGSAAKHLGIVGLAHGPGEPVRGAPTEQWTWGLFVDRERTADETLWLDAKTGLPLKRRVVVHFPEGDMEVGEEYDEVAVDVPLAPDVFRLAP
jgi:hypothetical protein